MRQRFQTEGGDRQQNDRHGENGHGARCRRALRVLEQQPDGTPELTLWKHGQLIVISAVAGEALVAAELVDDVGAEVVEFQLVGKYLDGNVQRTT